MARVLRLGLMLAALLSPGCDFIPEYMRPAAPVPEQYPVLAPPPAPAPATAAPSPVAAVADMSWREFFLDPQLRRLIDLALTNNRDLRIAAHNIERTRALYQIQRADQFPTVDATAGYLATRTPRSVIYQSDVSITQRQYNVGVGISAYEIDFFGRIRSLSEAALLQYLSTEESRLAAQISLIAAVADTYLILLADRDHLRLAEETLRNRQDAEDLIRRVTAIGLASDLDLSQAQTLVETARGDVARFTSLVQQDQNALRLLLGADIPQDIVSDGGLRPVTMLAELDPGLPSDLLLRRPDILAAERQIQSANASVGAARAAYFPRFSLTASAGLATDTLHHLVTNNGGGPSFEIAPSVTLPLLDFGRRDANLEVAKTDVLLAVDNYEKTIQTAFREVADALADRATLEQRLRAQQALVDASRTAARLSTARFRQGLGSYLAVLDAERTLYAAQHDLVTLRLSVYESLARLYKALGGGWK